MPLFNLNHSVSGDFAIYTEERAICRRVARRSLGAADSAQFMAVHGRPFSGSHEDRLVLPPRAQARVDRGIAKVLRRHPRVWLRSPVVARPVDRPKKKNLILNQLLDQLGSLEAYYGGDGGNGIMGYCALGTGTATPAVTDVALGAEVVRTSNYLTTEVNASGRTYTWTRIYDFPAETVNRNYTEVALSRYPSGANIGTRALLTGGTVTALVGQQARVAYSISASLPAANIPATPPVTGDSASFGSSAGELVFCTIGAVSKNAQASSALVLATGSTKPTFGTSYEGGTQILNSDAGVRAYATGSYKTVRWAKWGLAQANRTDLRAISQWGGYPSNGSWAFIFDAPKTKDNLHTLTVDWSITYGRA